MTTYIAIFLFELVSAYILWFILKKIVKPTKFYRFAITDVKFAVLPLCIYPRTSPRD